MTEKENQIGNESQLSRELVVKIKEKTYIIKFPNMGNIIDIETRKMALSGGRYSQLIEASLETSNRALDYIDMSSTFSVVIPELTKDLNVQSLFDLDVEVSGELLRVYKDEYFPWFKAWDKVINEASKK
jgi:hypothetical protein